EEEPQERRLPGPVGSDEPNRSVRDLDRQIVDRAHVAEDLRQPGRLNEHHGSLLSRGLPWRAECPAMSLLGFAVCGGPPGGGPKGGRSRQAPRRGGGGRSR